MAHSHTGDGGRGMCRTRLTGAEPCGRVDQPLPAPGRRLGAVGDAQLAQDGADVLLDGVQRHKRRPAMFSFDWPAATSVSAFKLPAGQLLDQAGRPCGRGACGTREAAPKARCSWGGGGGASSGPGRPAMPDAPSRAASTWRQNRPGRCLPHRGTARRPAGSCPGPAPTGEPTCRSPPARLPAPARGSARRRAWPSAGGAAPAQAATAAHAAGGQQNVALGWRSVQMTACLSSQASMNFSRARLEQPLGWRRPSSPSGSRMPL